MTIASFLAACRKCKCKCNLFEMLYDYINMRENYPETRQDNLPTIEYKLDSEDELDVYQSNAHLHLHL